MMTPQIPRMTIAALISKYCERSDSSTGELDVILRKQRRIYEPIGWILLECQNMSSSHAGQYAILPYGPENTVKALPLPTDLISPRGVARDTSTVIGFALADEVSELPRH